MISRMGVERSNHATNPPQLDEEGIRRAKLSSSRSFFLSPPPPLAPRFNGPSPLAGYGNEGKKRRGEGGRL